MPLALKYWGEGEYRLVLPRPHFNFLFFLGGNHIKVGALEDRAKGAGHTWMDRQSAPILGSHALS